jgi:hypothetical protein
MSIGAQSQIFSLISTYGRNSMALANIRAQCQRSEQNRCQHSNNLTLREEIDIVVWVLEEKLRISEAEESVG